MIQITPDMRAQAETMAGFGFRQDQIALVLGVSEPTLQRRCARELATGAQKANANVIKSLYQNAIGGNVAAQIFWAKARCGWREVQVLEHTGKDGAALHQADTRLENVSVASLEKLLAFLDKADA